MPNWAVYDTVTNRVKNYLTSSPIDPTYPVGVNEAALKDPSTANVFLLPLRYWKQSGGALAAMSQAEKDQVDTELAAASLAAIRTGGGNLLDANSTVGILLRGLADIMRDEINILRGWITDFKTDVAAATSLADLKTRVAANADLLDRTLSQIRTSIKNRMDSGSVDS